MKQPKPDDAVLGGWTEGPTPGALVLGTGKLYAKLFDRFNAEAKACNELYLRLQITPLVALIRKRKAMPLDDIKVKVWREGQLEDEGKLIDFPYAHWEFAGYLRHDGPLWGHTAKYDPSHCMVSLRSIAEKALREAAQ
jgi:hypothetical protein